MPIVDIFVSWSENLVERHLKNITFAMITREDTSRSKPARIDVDTTEFVRRITVWSGSDYVAEVLNCCSGETTFMATGYLDGSIPLAVQFDPFFRIMLIELDER